MDSAHKRKLEELVSQFPDSTRERALEDLKNHFSVYGEVDGKPNWINPDGTISETPKSCLLIEPEE